MKIKELLRESTTTLNKLYNGNFPDRDESFWDEVRPHEFDNELEVKVLPKHKLAIMLRDQYRVEHLDELLDMMDEDQQEILQRYMDDPKLSSKIILISGHRIIDGNHRALAAAMRGVPINYVDLADLDDQEVTEGFDSDKEYQGIIMSMLEGEDGFKLVAKSPEGKKLGFVEFSYDTDGTIRAEELEVYEKYRGQGIAKTMYDYVKNLGFKIARSDEQTPDGARFWDKNRPGKRIWEQDVTEAFDKEAGAWREWQLKMLPRKMEMLSRLVKGWVPSEEDHIAAIDAGYDAMKETGDVKDAAKAISDTFKEIQRRQGVAEANITSDDLTTEFIEHYKNDPVGMFMHAKSSYLDAVGKAKNFSVYAAKLSRSHESMSKNEFQDTVIKNFGVHLKKHGWPKHASPAWGEAEYDLIKELSNGVTEGKQQVERNGIQLNVSIDGATVDIRPMINGNQVGYVVFDRDGETLVADDLAIDEEYRRRGIAKIIYDYLKELGFTVKRSTDQLPAGKAFWDKYKGAQGQVWEDEHVDEMALKTYKTMGDFSKPGPFTGADKKLVPHPKNIEKATRFFEQTPFDFRLFFSHLTGTGKYSEHGPMTPDEIRKVFGQDAEEIINGSEDAITVVYVGNKGDAKVMLTPWMMAHRFGHALNRGAYKMGGSGAWKEAERYFFRTVNSLLNDYYGKIGRSTQDVKYELTPEYNALFNAVGTQRSSRSGEIRRPYEFFYELFAQYLGTGQITLNPFPTNLTYGRKAWGNPTRFMNIKPEYRDEGERKQAADRLAYTMELLFNDVLGDSVGKIFVM